MAKSKTDKNIFPVKSLKNVLRKLIEKNKKESGTHVRNINTEEFLDSIFRDRNENSYENAAFGEWYYIAKRSESGWKIPTAQEINDDIANLEQSWHGPIEYLEIIKALSSDSSIDKLFFRVARLYQTLSIMITFGQRYDPKGPLYYCIIITPQIESDTLNLRVYEYTDRPKRYIPQFHLDAIIALGIAKK